MLNTPTTDADLDFSLEAMSPPRRTGHIVPAERPARFAVVIHGRRVATLPTQERAESRARQIGGSVEVVR